LFLWPIQDGKEPSREAVLQAQVDGLKAYITETSRFVEAAKDHSEVRLIKQKMYDTALNTGVAGQFVLTFDPPGDIPDSSDESDDPVPEPTASAKKPSKSTSSGPASKPPSAKRPRIEPKDASSQQEAGPSNKELMDRIEAMTAFMQQKFQSSQVPVPAAEGVEGEQAAGQVAPE